jgi:hypothetical protein
MGRAELASNTVEGRMLEVQQSTLDMAGASRLDQIRASMAGEQLTGGAQRPAVTAGAEAAAASEERGREATVARLDEIRTSLNKEGAKSAGTNGVGKTGSGDAAAG